MKIQFLIFLLVALAFNHCNTALANPSALSTTSSYLSASASTTSFSPRIAFLGLHKPSATASNTPSDDKSSDNVGDEPSNNSTQPTNTAAQAAATSTGIKLIEIVGLVVVYAGTCLLCLAAWCACKYYKTTALGPAGVALKAVSTARNFI